MLLLLRFLFQLHMLITWYDFFSRTTKLLLLHHNMWLTRLFLSTKDFLAPFSTPLAHELVHHLDNLRNRLSLHAFAPEFS